MKKEEIYYELYKKKIWNKRIVFDRNIVLLMGCWEGVDDIVMMF